MSDRLQDKLFNETVPQIFQQQNLTKYAPLKAREEEFKLIFGVDLIDYVDPRGGGFKFSQFIRDFAPNATIPYNAEIRLLYGTKAACLIGELICI